MSEDLKFCCCTFICLRGLRSVRRRSCRMPDVQRKIYLILPRRYLNHSPIFAEIKKCCLDFRAHLRLSRPPFETERTKVSEIFLNLVCIDDWTMSSQNLVQFCACPFENTNVGIAPKSTYLNCNISAADCSSSLKIVIKYDHVKADTQKTFKVKKSKVKIMA